MKAKEIEKMSLSELATLERKIQSKRQSLDNHHDRWYDASCDKRVKEISKQIDKLDNERYRINKSHEASVKKFLLPSSGDHATYRYAKPTDIFAETNIRPEVLATMKKNGANPDKMSLKGVREFVDELIEKEAEKWLNDRPTIKARIAELKKQAEVLKRNEEAIKYKVYDELSDIDTAKDNALHKQLNRIWNAQEKLRKAKAKKEQNRISQAERHEMALKKVMEGF